MKKIIVIAAALLMGIAASAQTVTAGAAWSSITGKSTVGSTSTVSDPVNGFAIGMGYEMPIQGFFSLATGISANYFGEKTEGVVDAKSTYLGFEVPVFAKVSFQVADPVSVFAFAGPSVEWAAVSSTKIGDADPVSSIGEDGTLTSLYLNGRAGVGADILDMIRFTVSYGANLFNIAKEDAPFEMTRRALTIGVAYIF